jgi:hypothetical protein
MHQRNSKEHLFKNIIIKDALIPKCNQTRACSCHLNGASFTSPQSRSTAAQVSGSTMRRPAPRLAASGKTRPCFLDSVLRFSATEVTVYGVSRVDPNLRIDFLSPPASNLAQHRCPTLAKLGSYHGLGKDLKGLLRWFVLKGWRCAWHSP